MAQCSACDYTLECVAGCGIFCQHGCSDCTLWCEPHTTLTRVFREEGKKARVVVREMGDPIADAPRYSENEEFQFCFNGLSRDTLAQLLGSMLIRKVRAPADRAAEKISGSGRGTAAELAAKYDLIVE